MIGFFAGSVRRSDRDSPRGGGTEAEPRVLRVDNPGHTISMCDRRRALAGASYLTEGCQVSKLRSLFRVRSSLAVAILAIAAAPVLAQIQFTPCFQKCHDMAMEATATGIHESVVSWAFGRCIEENC